MSVSTRTGPDTGSGRRTLPIEVRFVIDGEVVEEREVTVPAEERMNATHSEEEIASSSADPPADQGGEDDPAVDQGDDEDGSPFGPILGGGLTALALLLLVGVYWWRRSGS